MKKQQFILIGSGIVLFCLIYFFGRTIPPKKSPAVAAAAPHSDHKEMDVKTILDASRQQLSPSQQAYVAQLETAVVRGDVKAQQIKVYRQLADFWKDSAHMLLPYGYYYGQAAKLENSQKNLTFAARFFLRGVHQQDNADLQRWMALEAKELFEKALQLDPQNDSLKIELGSCYLFGHISDMPMEGIRMIREVAEKDPANMYAQFTLGMGAMVSNQLDKAIERFTIVAQHEPSNLGAKLLLAEAYERKNDKANALKWYQESKKQTKEAQLIQDIDKRIDLLDKK